MNTRRLNPEDCAQELERPVPLKYTHQRAKTSSQCLYIKSKCKEKLTTGSQTDADARARKSVRTSNFTQQTNTLDVDKHMYVIHEHI
jgi:hypothetical protein